MYEAGQLQYIPLTRRTFIRQGTLLLAGSASLGAWGRIAAGENEKPRLRIGLVTDLHYADSPPRFHRYYRETSTKLAEAVRQFRRDKPELMVELGDIIEGSDAPEVEKRRLVQIVRQFRTTPGRHHYVVGNHCVYSLNKFEFLAIVGQKKSYYSFDAGAYHFVILDAYFHGDGRPFGRHTSHFTATHIPPAEVEWLRLDLKQTPHKSLVFVHHRLDHDPPYGVKNAIEVRKVLEDSGKVLAVLQGHYHLNDYNHTGNVHYVTLAAMVDGSGLENSAYALLELLPGDSIRIKGFRSQKSYESLM